MKRMILLVATAIAAASLVGTLQSGASSADGGPINAKQFFWAQGTAQAAATQDQITNDLIYHGGNAGPGAIGVIQKPKMYLIYWGTQWAQGFQTADTNGTLYSSNQLVNYINSMAKGFGGSAYAAVQTQYCNNVTAGSTSCVGASGYVTNPKNQFGGAWIDPSPVPDNIVTLGLAENLVDDPLAQEAVKATGHFGYDPNGVYIIMTPPGTSGVGEQAVYCGYHSQTTSVDGLGNQARVQYAFIPWQNTAVPALGQECGLHAVNATSNSFGNGVFDSWSIVIGHEYSEAVTDPDNFFGVQDGWNDDQTSENGDKCAWMDLQNVKFGSHVFAMQPEWSNEAFDASGNGCAFSR
ncbi:MAG TPA: hypothetical protein VHS03_15430 [Gaiellaceae bacterium]|nr:hypothetical protein [Gaiellaceae bacterium]